MTCLNWILLPCRWSPDTDYFFNTDTQSKTLLLLLLALGRTYNSSNAWKSSSCEGRHWSLSLAFAIVWSWLFEGWIHYQWSHPCSNCGMGRQSFRSALQFLICGRSPQTVLDPESTLFFYVALVCQNEMLLRMVWFPLGTNGKAVLAVWQLANIGSFVVQ